MFSKITHFPASTVTVWDAFVPIVTVKVNGVPAAMPVPPVLHSWRLPGGGTDLFVQTSAVSSPATIVTVATLPLSVTRPAGIVRQSTSSNPAGTTSVTATVPAATSILAVQLSGSAPPAVTTKLPSPATLNVNCLPTVAGSAPILQIFRNPFGTCLLRTISVVS